jgi:hypothetical protein
VTPAVDDTHRGRVDVRTSRASALLASEPRDTSTTMGSQAPMSPVMGSKATTRKSWELAGQAPVKVRPVSLVALPVAGAGTAIS